ncbi:pyridine nucleotide-disulfide oxidoreductase/dicluster-binding protein [Desulfovibrio intestinalis]|uniref:Fe-S oxidoreductase n=1 Tax=Desulfovibrio intestinalis TaxID=58621 RepID=A0A7W8C081_9BACT|nr:pyridine nucleotide-disulfide oxidoreductase/dicluster-binding protein [Desulfovibrio intestinalis]MBB5142062.1 Fe-S oxidoreductase [Desulfovibrio intestinalis]
MMDQKRLHEIEARCTQESPPRCREACPFDLDVRTFMARMAEGKPGEARKLMERHLPLPGIMARICDAPCENVCLRRDLGGSVAMHGLELACMLAVGPQGRPLPLPPKRFSIAVMGAGLAGLAAAWDLSRKAYPVTVFYAGTPSQAVLETYPQLGSHGDAACPKDFLAEDMELLARQKVQFVEAALDQSLLDKVAAEYAGVLVDAGVVPSLVPVLADLDEEILHWRDNICCAGWCNQTPTGHAFASSSRQAGQGRRAAQTLERVTSGVSLTAARNKEQGALHTDVKGIAPVPRVEPAEAVYAADEAVAEAARCLQCQCMICVRECVYLQKYKGYPRVYARQVHNNASIVKGLHTANALINGCALCGQCEELCPENFSMAELCLSAREDMVENGYMPPSAHEFALEDMENASGAECVLVLPDTSLPSGASPSWLFFPGCQLAASRGEQVARVYALLRERMAASADPGVALMLSCCGIPARWAGRANLFAEHMEKLRQAWIDLGKPRIMAACSSCLTALREALPEAEALSLWEVLDQMGLPDGPLVSLAPSVDEVDKSGNGQPVTGQGTAINLPEVFSIQDPCTARHDSAWLAAVRSLSRRAGARIEEPRLSGASTACCGYGGLVWCAQPELADEMAAHRSAELPHAGLASCIMCRDRMAASGKECWHLLDLLFPDCAHAGTGAEKGPGLSARRANRAALRRRLLREWLGQDAPEPGKGRVLMSQEMLTRLEERHILLGDIESAVVGAEASGHRFENLENGHILGSWRPRQVTFWVEYQPQGENFILHDAWCHRMVVPGSGGHEAVDVINSHQCCTDGQRGGQGGVQS